MQIFQTKHVLHPIFKTRLDGVDGVKWKIIWFDFTYTYCVFEYSISDLYFGILLAEVDFFLKEVDF